METFLENRKYYFLGQLELLDVLRALQNWAQLGSNLHDKPYSTVFMKYVRDNIWSMNFEENKFC